MQQVFYLSSHYLNLLQNQLGGWIKRDRPVALLQSKCEENLGLPPLKVVESGEKSGQSFGVWSCYFSQRWCFDCLQGEEMVLFASKWFELDPHQLRLEYLPLPPGSARAGSFQLDGCVKSLSGNALTQRGPHVSSDELFH